MRDPLVVIPLVLQVVLVVRLDFVISQGFRADDVNPSEKVKVPQSMWVDTAIHAPPDTILHTHTPQPLTVKPHPDHVSWMERHSTVTDGARQTTEGADDTLIVNFTTPWSGYVQSRSYLKFVGPVLSPWQDMPQQTATATVHVPADHVIMVSFKFHNLRCPTFGTLYHECTDPYVLFSHNGSHVKWLGGQYPSQFLSSAVYNHPLTVTYGYTAGRYRGGFRMWFSIHPVSESPQQLSSGKWNCSVPHYHSFKQHVQCNLQVECHGGEDEGGHCPFSHPSCDEGDVGVSDKCIKVHTALSQTGMRGHCAVRGWRHVTMRSDEEWRAFFYILERLKQLGDVRVGMRVTHQNYSLYNYGWRWQWDDKTMVYTADVPSSTQRLNVHPFYSMETYYISTNPYTINVTDVFELYDVEICESPMRGSLNRTSVTVKHTTITQHQATTAALPLVVCPEGHAILQMFQCDVTASCTARMLLYNCPLEMEGGEQGWPAATSVAMFVCDNKKESIPYTVVCDIRPDCTDGSDENFCVHSDCHAGIRCRNGECIATEEACDGHLHCMDGTDGNLMGCDPGKTKKVQTVLNLTRVPAPAVISHTGRNWTVRPMDESSACPDTHFRCPPSNGYCVPVYTRCNSVRDCPLGEDEVNCDNFQCPGYYRCRGSHVCLHVDHVCDGVPQCPQREDEKFCNTCPTGCRCLGLTFICHRPFVASNYVDLRYLDASHSNTTLQQLGQHGRLVYLKLASCGLTSVHSLHFPDLRHLDLSDNQIKQLQFDVFLSLRNLRVLTLSGNPLLTVTAGPSAMKHPNLTTLDMARSQLTVLNTSVLLHYTQLQHLNVSYSQISTINASGFLYIQHLTHLYLEGNPVRFVPAGVFRELRQLKVISVDDYRLCCARYLPEVFLMQGNECLAPEDELSSCEDLLRSDFFRMFMLMMCLMSLTGNVVSAAFRLLRERRSPSAFNLFVVNLCVADFLMGVYLAIIFGADQRFRGDYLLHEVNWKWSSLCQTAGFLSLLSCEVSAFIIFLITLDRFVVLRFPFTVIRFGRRSAAVACGVAWLVGIILAGTPLLPVTAHWEFYSQSGICIPLPVTRRPYEGRGYAFGVMIVLNFIQFLFIAAGQAAILSSVRASLLTTDTNQKSRDIVIARRLISVAVSDFLCWFPIGLVGLLASAGVPVPGEVNVIMVIFVLPFNAAINPLLYTVNLMLERSRRRRHQKLLKLLETGGLAYQQGLDSATSPTDVTNTRASHGPKPASDAQQCK